MSKADFDDGDGWLLSREDKSDFVRKVNAPARRGAWVEQSDGALIVSGVCRFRTEDGDQTTLAFRRARWWDFVWRWVKERVGLE